LLAIFGMAWRFMDDQPRNRRILLCVDRDPAGDGDLLIERIKSSIDFEPYLI
jgi:hypothetical protein